MERATETSDSMQQADEVVRDTYFSFRNSRIASLAFKTLLIYT